MEEPLKESNGATCPPNCIYKQWVFRLLVGAQFIVAALIVLTLKHPGHRRELWAFVLAGFAVWFAGWMAIGARQVRVGPRPAADGQLVRRGPYRWIRHPMYAGLMLAALGFILSDATLYGWQLGLSLMVVLRIKSGYEEQELSLRFPDYAEYCRTTKRFVPFLW